MIKYLTIYYLDIEGKDVIAYSMESQTHSNREFVVGIGIGKIPATNILKLLLQPQFVKSTKWWF